MLGLHPGIAQAVRPRLPPCLCALLCLSYFLFYFEDGLFVLNLAFGSSSSVSVTLSVFKFVHCFNPYITVMQRNAAGRQPL